VCSAKEKSFGCEAVSCRKLNVPLTLLNTELKEILFTMYMYIHQSCSVHLIYINYVSFWDSWSKNC